MRFLLVNLIPGMLGGVASMILVSMLVQKGRGAPVAVFESVAWLLILCTYAGLAPAELIFGPRNGLTRNVTKAWRTSSLYFAIFSGLFGLLVGVSIMHAITGSSVLIGFVCLLIAYHFIIRHVWTEGKGGPHLGQRGTKGEKKLEVWLGQVGDLLIVALLVGIWRLTGHALWLLGTAVMLGGYMVGVWVHRHWDRRPRSASSYLAALLALIATSVSVLLLGLIPEISNTVIGSSGLVGCFATAGLGLRSGSVPLVIAAVGLLVGVCVNGFFGQSPIQSGFTTMLIATRPPSVGVFRYWTWLLTMAFFINILWSEALSGFRKRSE